MKLSKLLCTSIFFLFSTFIFATEAVAQNQDKDTSAHEYTQRGFAHTVQGENEAAVIDFSKAINIDPNYANAYYNRALIYHKQGKVNLAIADLTKAIEIDPNNAKGYHARAILYYKHQDYELGLLDYEKAMQCGLVGSHQRATASRSDRSISKL